MRQEFKGSTVNPKFYSQFNQFILISADPYVKVSLMCEGRRLKKRKTSTKRNTLNPIYNEAIVFDVPPENIDQISLMIAVMDYDRWAATLSAHQNLTEDVRLVHVLIDVPAAVLAHSLTRLTFSLGWKNSSLYWETTKPEMETGDSFFVCSALHIIHNWWYYSLSVVHSCRM